MMVMMVMMVIMMTVEMMMMEVIMMVMMSTIIVIQVRERYPGSKCDLQTDRLYVDGRMFVWNKRAEKVFVEQLIIISKL